MPQNLRTRDAAMPFIMLTVLIDRTPTGLIIAVLPELVGSNSRPLIQNEINRNRADTQQAPCPGTIADMFNTSLKGQPL